MAPDSREHGGLPPGVPPGREGLKAIARAVRSAFPDLKCTIDLQVAEGDLVASKITYTGTMKGELWGMPATGMVRQLGLAPAPPTAAGAR